MRGHMIPPEPPRQDKGWAPQAPLGNALLAPLAGTLMAEARPEEVISGLQCEVTNTPSELMQQEGQVLTLCHVFPSLCPWQTSPMDYPFPSTEPGTAPEPFQYRTPGSRKELAAGPDTHW